MLKACNSSRYDDDQIRKLDHELKAHNSRSSTAIPCLILLVGFALLLHFGSQQPGIFDDRILAALGVLLFALFVMWEIKKYREFKRFANNFYSSALPSVLQNAYAAYSPRTGAPDASFFAPSETWLYPTTVTFLVLSANDKSIRAQGIYRIQRDYFEADYHADKDNDDSGRYRVTQDLIWKVKLPQNSPYHLTVQFKTGMVRKAFSSVAGKLYNRLAKNGMQDIKIGRDSFDRDFLVNADDDVWAEQFLRMRWQQIVALRDTMGQFSLEYGDGMLTLSFFDFAPIDTKNAWSTGLPCRLTVDRLAATTKQLEFLSDWLVRFLPEEKMDGRSAL